MISFRTAMFSFRETYFRLEGLFDWGYARTQFLLSVSRNRYGFTLARYRNEKSATDPALVICYLHISTQLGRNHNYQSKCRILMQLQFLQMAVKFSDILIQRKNIITAQLPKFVAYPSLSLAFLVIETLFTIIYPCTIVH